MSARVPERGSGGASVRRRVLPGFGPALGVTLTYLCLLVLIPLSGVFLRASGMSGADFMEAVSNSRAMAAYRLTFGASLAAAAINAVFGLLVAWVLVRYPFPGRRVVDAMVDLPFAMPTAVAGLALTFIGLPFVVRTVQPVLQDLELEVEEAAASLGASRGQTFVRITLPGVLPALVTGFTLAFARALGEYGSVVFISGNLPFKTEITTLLIMTKLEQYDYAGATAIASVMLVISFALLLAINILQAWARRRGNAPLQATV